MSKKDKDNNKTKGGLDGANGPQVVDDNSNLKINDICVSLEYMCSLLDDAMMPSARDISPVSSPTSSPAPRKSRSKSLKKLFSFKKKELELNDGQVFSVVCDEWIPFAPKLLQWCGSNVSDTLTSLKISLCDGLAEADIRPLLQCQRLHSLHLGASSSSGESAATVKVTLPLLADIAQVFVELEELTFTGVEVTLPFAQEGNAYTKTFPHRIRCLQKLTLLSPKITLDGLGVLLTWADKLTALNMSHSSLEQSLHLEHESLQQLSCVQCVGLRSFALRCPKLTMLNLSDSLNVTSIDLKGTSSLEILKLSSTGVSTELLESLLKAHSKTLKELHLRFCTKVVGSLKHDILLPKLSVLDVSKSPVSSQLLSQLCSIARSLEHLNISGCLDVEDVEMLCPSLVHADVHDTAINNFSLQQLCDSFSRNITFLDFGDCPNISNIDLVCPKLENLITSTCKRLVSIGLHCPNLKQWNTSGSYRLKTVNNICDSYVQLNRLGLRDTALTHKTIQSLISKSMQLDTLKVSETEVEAININSRTMKILGASSCFDLKSVHLSSPLLEEFSMSKCENVKTALVSTDSPKFTSLELSSVPRMKKLTVEATHLVDLSLKDCDLGDLDVAAAVTGAGSLKRLRLDHIYSLHNLVIDHNHLEEFALQACEQLVTLDVSGCPRLRNMALIALPIFNDKGLDGCLQETGSCLESILLMSLDMLQHAIIRHDSLQSVTISSCVGLRSVTLSGKKVTSFSCTDCEEMKENRVDASGCPKLEDITLQHGQQEMDHRSKAKEDCAIQ